ncbi:MAG: sugar phosphate nucleotidyltransferase [Armatimonadia bacterium]
MKVAILAGGRGTRLLGGESSHPKALFEIGGRPIIWHIMNIYGAAGYRDFLLLLGYKADEVVDYFVNRLPFQGRDLRVRISEQAAPELLDGGPQTDWSVTLCDTGLEAEKGERIRKARKYLMDDEDFMVTYGDGLIDLDPRVLMDFHRSHGKIATVTAIRARSQFGHVEVAENGQVRQMRENPMLPEWINGGFFVFNRRIFDCLDPYDTLETGCLRKLAEIGELMAYRHEGFWACMDTYKDNLRLNDLWDSGQAPWAR